MSSFFHVHFIGIGGIGMSGLAQILIAQGINVSGCDLNINQETVQKLHTHGISIAPHHQDEEICYHPSISHVIYNSMILDNNPEIARARALGIPVLHRSDLLASLMQQKKAIAVSGSHGKTTTTAMIAHIFKINNYDPTALVGGIMPQVQSNVLLGKGGKNDHFISEADESDRSFLKLPAYIKVVTNIDFEHVETYESMRDLCDTFALFLNAIPAHGYSVVCIDNPHIRKLVAENPQTNFITYGTTPDADFYADQITLNRYQLHYKKWDISVPVVLPVCGTHNILNSIAACATAFLCGIKLRQSSAALTSFQAVDRRMSIRGTFKNALVIDDYAHHPTEINATVQTVKQQRIGKLIIIFQPHRYTRTAGLWDDFVATLGKLDGDELIITDLYGAGEPPLELPSLQTMVYQIHLQNPIQSTRYIPYDLIQEYLDAFNIFESSDTILFLGAGNISTLSHKIVEAV